MARRVKQKMHRTTVFFSEVQENGLREVSAREGLGVATLIRLAVAELLKKRRKEAAAEKAAA